MGRLTRDPGVRYTQRNSSQESMAIARYTLAVDRRIRKEGETNADFISCVVFGKAAEFAEKYFHQGLKVVVAGRIQTGSYTNKDGQKVYTTEVVIEEQEFAESKANNTGQKSTDQNADGSRQAPSIDEDGFMNIPDGIDEELPFN